MAGTKDIKDFTKYASLSDDDYLLGTKTSLNGTDASIKVGDLKKQVANDAAPSINDSGYWVVNGVSTGVKAAGETPVFEGGTTTTGNPGTQASSELISNGATESGQPRYKLNLTIPRGADGDAPVLEIGTVEKGTEASAAITPNGTDTSGNTKYKLDLVLPKGDAGNNGDAGDDGKTPKFETGTVTTLEPGQSAAAQIAFKQNDTDGTPIYTISLSLPKGNTGADGTDGADGLDGKTPVLEIGTVEKGTNASAAVMANGTDAEGNPKYKIDLVLPEGNPGADGTDGTDGLDGKTPVLEIGTVTTGDAGTDASATITANGTDLSGNPKYKLNITIPRGEQGLPGEGSGNVSVSGSGLVTTKKYLFVPDSNGSTAGSFVEYVAPVIPTKTSDLENDDNFITESDLSEKGYATTSSVNTALDGKVDKMADKGLSTNDYTTAEKDKLANLSPVATSGSYNDLSDKPAILSESAVDQKINNAVASVYRVKGSVASYSSLPTSDVAIGDVYNIEDTGANYVATSTNPIAWDKLSETVDLSAYLTQADASNTYQPKGNYVAEAPSDGKSYGRKNGAWAEITTGAGSDDYVVTIASAAKRLFNAGANTIAQAAAETFLGPIDDLLAAVDAGKKVYIKNTEAKTLTELKVLHRTSNLATFFSQWAKEAFHVIDLRTVINSDKSVTNYGIRYGYQYPFQLDINAGGGIQELYGLSGDKTLTVKPDTFAPELGCVTTVMLSTLASSAANVTIAADSTLEGKFSVVGDNPITIPANSIVELSIMFTQAYQTKMYIARYSEPFTRPS